MGGVTDWEDTTKTTSTRRNLRDYADAVDKDRGFETGLTYTMREAASQIAALVARVEELEQALREIADLDDKTYYDDPVAGFAAVARAALGEKQT